VAKSGGRTKGTGRRHSSGKSKKGHGSQGDDEYWQVYKPFKGEPSQLGVGPRPKKGIGGGHGMA